MATAVPVPPTVSMTLWASVAWVEVRMVMPLSKAKGALVEAVIVVVVAVPGTVSVTPLV